MTVEECYIMMNGNYKTILERMQMESLVERFMIKFLSDKTMDKLKEAVENNDIEAAFQGAHNLKGLASNLSFDELTMAAHNLTEQLRGRDKPIDPDLYAIVERSYQKTILAIEQYVDEK